MLQQKIDLDKQKKEAEENALAKEKERDSKIKTIGNYVHDSVPISDNEVSSLSYFVCLDKSLTWYSLG